MTTTRNKKLISITLSLDTIEQLELLAQEQHCSKSQTVTNLVWSAAKGVDGNGNKETKAQKR